MLPFCALTERRLLLLALLPGAWLSLTMPVFAQESYYWTYSQHPALSYFDHPPMVAWLIWLGTAVFGDGATGIRLATFLCGACTLLLGRSLLLAFGASANARRGWLVLASCVPILMMTRFLANPDPPLAVFWLATIVALWHARTGKLGWWAVAGLAAGCALLSKYTAAFLAVGGAIVLLCDAPMRRQLRRPGPFLGVVVAAITFLPVVLWNVGNDFESFRFQTAGRWERAQLTWRWFAEFASGQLGLFNPFLAVLLPAAIAWLWRRARGKDGATDPRATWLLAFGLPLPLFFLANTVAVQVKANWIVPAYLPLLLGLALWWDESGFTVRHPQRARRLLAGALALLVVVPLAPVVIRLVPQKRGSSWTGWTDLAARAEHWEERLDKEDGIEGNVFFFAADYKDAAQLSRSLQILHEGLDEPHRLEPTLAQNVLGEAALQFDHWEPPLHHVGENAIFVLPRAADRSSIVDKVRARFRSIDRVDQVQITRLGVDVLNADVYVCRDYRGPQAPH